MIHSIFDENGREVGSVDSNSLEEFIKQCDKINSLRRTKTALIIVKPMYIGTGSDSLRLNLYSDYHISLIPNV